MGRLKEKNGSIILGVLFFITIIVSFSVFMFEGNLMYSVKGKAESVAKNISSSIVLNIDKDVLLEEGIMSLSKDVEIVANKILANSSLKTDSFDYVSVDIYEQNLHGEVEVEVAVSLTSKNNFVFFKDTQINASSTHVARLDEMFLELEPEEFQELSWDYLVDYITISEVF